ncbi:hypothetical protein CEXT_709351 [Caerostris extrusa]|uniref:Uncharacterized protein n=1 Tax=Caerostris extrusa TaxID=172846 RepID=A0AAV4TRR3_CAEEX|nr:hypothetical protein CEXT_709351 [Caerostris extrusa]
MHFPQFRNRKLCHKLQHNPRSPYDTKTTPLTKTKQNNTTQHFSTFFLLANTTCPRTIYLLIIVPLFIVNDNSKACWNNGESEAKVHLLTPSLMRHAHEEWRCFAASGKIIVWFPSHRNGGSNYGIRNDEK